MKEFSDTVKQRLTTTGSRLISMLMSTDVVLKVKKTGDGDYGWTVNTNVFYAACVADPMRLVFQKQVGEDTLDVHGSLRVVMEVYQSINENKYEKMFDCSDN